MEAGIDLKSLDRALDRFRAACPFDEGRALADRIDSFGRGLESLDSLIAGTDAEVRRLLAAFESGDDAAPDSEPSPEEPPRAETPHMDNDTEPNSVDNEPQSGDAEPETPDEADLVRAKLQAPLDGAMRKFADSLLALDDAISLEVKTKEVLDKAAGDLNGLEELQGMPRLDSSKHALQTAKLRREIDECRRVENEARRAADEYGRLSGAQFAGVVRELVFKAETYAKNHFWSGPADEIKQRAKKADEELRENGRQAAGRREKASSIVARAQAAIRTKEARLNALGGQESADGALQRKIEERGRAIQSALDSLHRELASKLGRGCPEVVRGGWSGSRWNLSLADSKTVLHPLLTRRMDAARSCQVLCRGVAKSQPPLEELSSESLNSSSVFPPAVAMGSMLYTHSRPGVEVEIPDLVEMPGDMPVLVPAASWIAPLLLRLAWAMPAGGLEIVALDQASSGMNVQPANDLSDVPGLLRVVTGADGLQPALEELDRYMGRLGTERFKHGIADWSAYNAKYVRHPLPCKVLAVCSLAGFDSWSSLASTLRKVIDNGKRHGIVTLVCADALAAADDRTRKALDGVVWRRLGEPFPGFKPNRLKYESVAPEMPDDAGEKMRKLSEAARKKAEQPVKTFMKLFDGVPMWEASSADGLQAPIGWNQSGRTAFFKLDTGGEGGTAVHALVGGQTGSGKSVLLHALIQSLAYVYSPDKLQFYLFDFKNGVEFNKYSDGSGSLWLPHVKVVSVQNDPRYALELFKHLVEVEFPARNEKFKRTGCTKIGDYVRKGGKMPRLVVIVDEFQELFGDHDGEDIGEELTAGLKAIVKQGRSVGVHLVIATQTMASAHATMKGSASDILQQIGLRLALWGTGEEGILADNNKSAASIVPRKQCILNAKAGLKGGDAVFDFPFASPDSPDGPVYRKKMEDATRSRGFACDGKMFNGSVFPAPPSPQVLKSRLDGAREESLFALGIGVLPDFAATPMIVPFDNLAGEHLLVAGEDAGRLAGDLSPVEAWSGLRSSVVRSLAATPSCAVLYYNAGSSSLPDGLPPGSLRATLKTTESELLELFRRLLKRPEDKKVVVVENYHKAGLLHPANKQPAAFSFGGAPTQPPPETARSVFLSAFGDAGTVPFSTVLFTKNVKNTCEKVLGRFGSEANILDACSKRVAFNVVGDVLKTMIPDVTFQQQRGPRRIWYEDRKTGLVQSFVPYAGS